MEHPTETPVDEVDRSTERPKLTQPKPVISLDCLVSFSSVSSTPYIRGSRGRHPSVTRPTRGIDFQVESSPGEVRREREVPRSLEREGT